MTAPLDLAAIARLWEEFEAACAGLLAGACKYHAPYMGCPLDCGDVANAIGDEFAAARTAVPALLAEIAALRGEVERMRPVVEAARAWLAAERAWLFAGDATEVTGASKLIRTTTKALESALDALDAAGTVGT